MTFVDLVRRSGRSLKSAKLRTLLTALAIAVGGFTICLTLAAGNGVRDYTQKLIASNFDPAELLVGRDKEIQNNGSPSSSPKEYDDSIGSFTDAGGGASIQYKQVSREDINTIKTLPFVESVRENYLLNIRYVTSEGQKQFTGSLVAFNPAQKPDMVYGELPKSGDIEKGTILLPEDYIGLFGFESAEAAIGKKVTVVTEGPFTIASLQGGASKEDLKSTFTVVGVTRKPATSLSFGVQPMTISTPDAKVIYDFTAEGTANYDQYLYVYVRVVNGSDKQLIADAQSKLKDLGFYSQSSDDIQKTITQFVDILQGIVVALGLVTLVASVFGIVNTQYISVLERTREIGLIKALGMSRRKVQTLFILEAMWIGFIGGLIGVVLAYILGIFINPPINNALDLSVGTNLIIFDVKQMIALLLALMFVAAAAGFFPARKAAKLDPVEALRAE